MKSKSLLSCVTIAAAVSLLSIHPLFAQEKMKYEDYQIELQEWKEKEAAAQQQIAALQEQIAGLQQQLNGLNRRINEVENAIWAELNSSSEGLRDITAELGQLRDQIQGLLNLDPGELYKRGEEVERLLNRFNELTSKGVAKHPEAHSLIDKAREELTNLKDAQESAEPPFNVYKVNRGDYLWRIAKKPDVYNNPFQWIRIYTKNRDLIKDPDLIFPGQEFKIFNDVLGNEHLVARGEYLSKIAGYQQVYNDPFKWTLLYELNNDVIEDKDLIYPHMILLIR